MFQGTPFQIYVQATCFWIGCCIIRAAMNWQDVGAHLWDVVIGNAIGAYIVATFVVILRFIGIRYFDRR